MTPTDPLPAACRSFNWAIAENDASNDLTPSPAGTVALAEVPAVELPPPAARTMANAPVDAKKVTVRSVRHCFPLLRFKGFPQSRSHIVPWRRPAAAGARPLSTKDALTLSTDSQ